MCVSSFRTLCSPAAGGGREPGDTVRTRGGRGVPTSLLLFPSPFLGHRDCFHDVEVAGGDSECSVLRAPGETLRTAPISRQPFGSQGAPGLPHRCQDAGAGPWTAPTLPCVGCSQQPPVHPLRASWSPARSTSPPWASPSRWQSCSQIKSVLLSPSPICCVTAWPWGGRWGCGYLSRARIWAVFLSLKMSAPPGLQTHSPLPRSVEVCGFLLTPYMPVADKIWPVIVETPACATLFFSQQNPYVAAFRREESRVNFSCLALLI